MKISHYSITLLLLAIGWQTLFSLSSFGQVYLNENFNGNSFPTGWTNTNEGTGACQWMIHSPFSAVGTPINMLGSNFLFVSSDSAGSGTVAKEIFTSPIVSIPAGNVAFLEFQHYYRAGGSLRLDTGSVEVFNGQGWQRVSATFTNQGTGNSPVAVKINISSLVNPSLRIRFRYVGNYAYYWAIDNVKISTPAANDVGVVSILNASGPCGITNSTSVAVKIVNFGSQAQTNFPVKYQVNGGAFVSQNFTNSLAAGDSSIFVFTTPFSATNPGNYYLTSLTDLSNDEDRTNDTIKNVVLRKEPKGFNTVSFTGFTGSDLATVFPGWSEATGLNPTGTTGGWMRSSTSQETAFGTTTAKINLYSASKKDWIISPAINPVAGSALQYKVAVTNWNNGESDEMGSDDSLIVKISTNCGQTWTKLKTYTKANQPTNQLTQELISLSAYAGSTVKIGFYATEGIVDDINDYDVHIDDVEVFVQSPNDLALTAIENVNSQCGVGESLLLKVKVLNNGTQPQTSIPVAFSVNGQTPVQETFTQNLAPGASASFTFTTPILFPNSGTYLISAWTNLPTDQNNQNDSIRNISVKKAPIGFNPITFTGFTGANLETIFPSWQEATGLNPSGTTSSWLNSSATQTTGLGSATAKINLYAASKKEWIISPAVTPTSSSVVKFRLAVTNLSGINEATMGSDDSLVVKVTTDCGQTWTRIKAYTAADQLANTLTSYMVPLANYANQTIRLGFFATEGVVNDIEDYDLHIDDIEVSVQGPNDLALTAIENLSSQCGVGESIQLKLKVFNNGTQAQTNIPLAFSVNGQSPVQETFTQNLAPGASASFTFTTPIQFPTSGVYLISAWTNLPADQNRQNDSIRNVSVQKSPVGFNPITFTGFTGSNLETVFPGWTEATGLTATGNTSAWTSSSASQTTGLGSATAKVNLYTATKKEWIISPAVTPTANSVVKFKLAITNFTGINSAIMGSDDSLVIKVTTDCGQTWTRIKSYTTADQLSNSLTSYIVPLASYANQTIRIGFFATEGVVDDINDYDLHIDDIEVYVPSPNDLGLVAMILPDQTCGAGSSLQLKVRVINNGTETQTAIPVEYSVNGQTPVLETFTQSLASGESINLTFSTPIPFTNPGNYSISAWTKLGLDQNFQNDSIKNVQVTRPGASFSPMTFTGFTGANLGIIFPGWSEATGLNGNVGTTSGWTSSSANQTTALGSATARVNLFTNTRKEWIKSPAFVPTAGYVVKLRIAVTSQGGIAPATMGADDSLIVKLSSDCGQTWTRARWWTATSNLTNQLTEYLVPLTDYAGKNVLVGIYATDGSADNIQDYDVHVDDIQLTLPLTNDVGATDIVFPAGNCGVPASFSISVKVVNFGIDAQSNIPVSYSIDGQTPITETVAGPLAPGTSFNYTFSAPVNLATNGNFSFSAWTSMSNDANIANDSILNQVVFRPDNFLILNDFNAYDGSNLETVYQGWYEALGRNPSANSSTWVNSSGSQSNYFQTTTARINMNSNNKREWIVSPVFVPQAASMLQFKVAVTSRNFALPSTMGSDDSVNVMITSNCGQSWTLLRAFTAADNLTAPLQNFSLPLASFEGQPVRIGFFATDGTINNTEDFDFHVDDVFASISTASNELVEFGLRMYPNPASNQVFIDFDQPISSGDFVQICSLDGRTIGEPQSLEIGQTRTKLDLSNLPSGMYFLKMGIGNKMVVKSLMINH